MAATAMTPAEKAAQLRVLSLFRKAVEERGRRIPYDLLAQRLAVSRDTVEAWFKRGDRRISPERMRDIARTLDVDPVSVFVEAGWLDADDVQRFVAGMLGGAPGVGQSAGPAANAPQRAADLVLHHPVLRERFDVTLSTLVSSGSYRLATDLVAEFRLRPGVAAIPLSEALARAEGLRGVWWPDDDLAATEPEYCAVRVELAAAFHWPLRECGRYTWQGDPGSTVWKQSTYQWPAHVMVQDVVSGLSGPAASTGGWTPIAPRPIVVIGGRYSSGLAAALLAEALGWQFALVSSTTLVRPDGSVGAVHRPWDDGPAYAWSDAYAYLTERHAGGDPWRCVLLVRPYSFLTRDEKVDLRALEQLRRAETQVVYARPSEGALLWFTERQIALAASQTYRPRAQRWLETTRAALSGIEDVLGYRRARSPGQDLAVAMPEPVGQLEVCDPRVPAELVDAQVRLAWHIIRWLSPRAAYAGPSLVKALCAGSLLDWRELLETDQVPGPTALHTGT